MYINPKGIIDPKNITPSEIIWKSPSNIALVKYWGKHGIQLPRNPSISFTLDAAHTITSLKFDTKSSSEAIEMDFLFEGKKEPLFEKKIKKFLQSLVPIFPFLEQIKLSIKSKNSFPHSSGIASSASSMSALALCLVSLEEELLNQKLSNKEFDKKSSYIARLGSGSAARSIFESASMWGRLPMVEESSDEFGIGVGEALHPIFQEFHDDILIVSSATKPVSSRLGHELMNNNPFSKTRYETAFAATERLYTILQKGKLEDFIELVEKEALTLHALMMCSTPSFILMKPNTLAMIEKIQAFRQETGLPLCFTLDAGPNIHLLYPNTIVDEVKKFRDSELLPLCEDGYILEDFVGNGPKELETF